MNQPSRPPSLPLYADNRRMDVADVLRGIAVMGILLLHSIEHFNYYRFPDEASCGLVAFTDKAVWDGLFFAFSGKAYAVFSLLFGFTFFLQDERRRLQGGDFRPRFVWRLVLLFILGNINAAFFPGEVLVLFSIVGLALPLVARLSDRWVLTIAVAMLMQPDFIAGIVRASVGSVREGAGMAYVPWAEATLEAIDTGDFWETLRSNLTNGQKYSLLWARDYGRMMQSPALMMIGMLIGRRGLFADTEKNIRFWMKAALVGLVCFFPLKGIADMIPQYVGNEALRDSLGQLFGAWHKLAFMVFEMGAIIVVFYRTRLRETLMRITPPGRMSLTMYISQSLLGSFFFFPWGLDLGRSLGSTATLGVAAVMFAVLYAFATLWLARHGQGPLEYVWRKATWVGSKNLCGRKPKTSS